MRVFVADGVLQIVRGQRAVGITLIPHFNPWPIWFEKGRNTYVSWMWISVVWRSKMPCRSRWGALECELPAGHREKHACATGWDNDGRVDDGVTWSDPTLGDRMIAFHEALSPRSSEVPF